MAGGEEGQQIVRHRLIVEPGAQEKVQEVGGAAFLFRRWPGPARHSDPGHLAAKILDHAAGLGLADARDPAGQMDQGERVRHTAQLQQDVDALRELGLVQRLIAGEERLHQHIQGQIDHELGHGFGLAVPLCQTVRGLLAHLADQRGEGIDLARREDWRDGLAGFLPRLAFRRQQAVAQEGFQHRLAQRVHGEIVGPRDKAVMDALRVGEQQVGAAQKAEGRHADGEMVLAPDLQRIAPHCLEIGQIVRQAQLAECGIFRIGRAGRFKSLGHGNSLPGQD